MAVDSNEPRRTSRQDDVTQRLPKPPRGDETVRLPSRPIACTACAKETLHQLHQQEGGCAWVCIFCGAIAASYTHADMQAMVAAYAGPLAKAANLPPRPELSEADRTTMEVDVEPPNGGELITYSGVAIERHLNACHAMPTQGEMFWGHHPAMPPHVAKFELGKIVAVRRGTTHRAP